MYSQNDEETVILDTFRNRSDGRLLDIGAYEGKTFSNTLALIEKGWSGTLIEASSGPFRKLIDLHQGRPDINLVNACVAVDPPVDLVKFYSSDDAVGSFDEEHYAKWESYGGFTPVYMPIIDIRKVLEVFPGPYDFVNIDIEGEVTEAVFKTLDYKALGTKLVCVEHGGHKEKAIMRDVGMRLGLVLAHETKENHLWRVPQD